MRTNTTTYGTYPVHEAFEALKPAARVAKNVGLFIAAPFVGLAYVVVGPLVALGALVWLGGRALMNRKAA